MKSTLILLLVAITFSVTAQHSYIPSERTFTTKDGLSSDKIHALHKDSQGFIWIGTENGLDRFDGLHFVHFNKNTHSSMTLDRVQMILEDEEGYLWLVERNKQFEHHFVRPQITFYNIHTGEWLTLEERFGDKIKFDKEQINFIKQLEDGSIFLFINNSTTSYLYQKGHFKVVKTSKETYRVSDVMMEKNDELILEGTKGPAAEMRHIIKTNKAGQILQQVHANAAFRIQSSSQSYDLKLSAKNGLIGARNLDLYQFISPDLAFTPTKNGVWIDQAIINKKQDLIWFKGENNIFVTKSNGDIVYQKEIQQDHFEMPLLFDGHTTWYSDKQHGLVALTLSPNHFQVYQSLKDGFNNSARGIFADTKGSIWISTINGLLHKTPQSNDFQFEHLDFFTPFLKDKSNNLWSMRVGKILKTDLSTGQEQSFKYTHEINHWAIHQADNGNLWFFGNMGTFLLFNIKTNTFQLQPSLPTHEAAFYVYHILKNDAQSVWLSTNQGLYLVDNHGKYIAHYNQLQKDEFYLPTKDIHHSYIDKNGTMWLATGDAGLIQLRIKNYQLSIENQFTTENGLSCDILHSVYEDDAEYLWISSNEGLMQMDKRTGQVMTYTTENGLLHNEFNRISHFQAEDGTLYFGGLTGVISFHPRHFSTVRHDGRQAPLVITDFQQFSAKKGQFENLTQQLTQSNTIRLKPNDRFFKLKIALLNFKNEATYQYRIKGLYDWQTTDDSELNISGLPYGKYILEIKAFNENHHEAANILTYTIHVLKPFYLQWWFLLVVLGSLGTGAFYFLKWRTQQMLVFQETEQLRQLDTMKSQFFANISHELRTPLTLILAPLSQLLKDKDLPKKYKSKISNVHSNGKNLLNLVNEVLDLSKLEANKLELHQVPTKIPQFIERIVANFESAAKVKGVEYQFLSFLQKCIVAQFDQPKLEKVLNNLLSNALKFTPKEGTIQIMVTQIENDLVIKVKDSGKGIAAEDLPHIFDRYFSVMPNLYSAQSNNKKIEGGTGIGLALTKELVELMNGQILVQSELGEGTEFEVRLPIELVTSDLLLVTSETDTENSSLLNFQSLVNLNETISKNKDTILLVEDNPSLQQFIHSILAPYYNVKVSNNGLEALNYLTNHQSPITNHLILSDVMMPEMDGFTLLEKVKSDDRFCSIPFILLTARADINDKLKGLRIGVDDYMTKPFEVEELLLRIKNLITNAKNRQVEPIQETKSKPKVKRRKTAEQPTSLTRLDRVITNHQQSLSTEREKSPITSHDLDWLEKVETIAKREIRNSKYTVDELANELFVSKRQLFRKIKQVTGLTPMKYIKTVRLQTAKHLLETEDIATLTEVSYAVGFENPSHFAKSFEAEFGKRPHDMLVKVK